MLRELYSLKIQTLLMEFQFILSSTHTHTTRQDKRNKTKCSMEKNVAARRKRKCSLMDSSGNKKKMMMMMMMLMVAKKIVKVFVFAVTMPDRNKISLVNKKVCLGKKKRSLLISQK